MSTAKTNSEELYMNTVSGDIQTLEEWREDYESMEPVLWFGSGEYDEDSWLDVLEPVLVEVDSHGATIATEWSA